MSAHYFNQYQPRWGRASEETTQALNPHLHGQCMAQKITKAYKNIVRLLHDSFCSQEYIHYWCEQSTCTAKPAGKGSNNPACQSRCHWVQSRSGASDVSDTLVEVAHFWWIAVGMCLTSFSACRSKQWSQPKSTRKQPERIPDAPCRPVRT